MMGDVLMRNDLLEDTRILGCIEHLLFPLIL
jgi:hypothetical protein